MGTAVWSFLFKFLEQVSTLKRGCKPIHSLVRIPSNPSPPHGKTAQASHVSQINPAPFRPRAREKAVGPRGAEAESWRPDIAGRRTQRKVLLRPP